MSEAIDVIAANPMRAHEAVQHGWALAKALTIAGRKAHIQIREAEDDRSVRQNAYYWAVVLKEISEQAAIEGQRWTADAWHELCKRQFLGYEIKKVKVAGRKKATIIRRLRSTTGLSVRKFSDYLEQILAFASTDLSVRFSVSRWEDYAP
jgi:NinB protein